jgi:hypothetical protein
MLIDMLYYNKKSLYQLQKETNIPYATLHDLYSLKTNPDKINVKTLKKFADAFNLSLDAMYDKLLKCDIKLYSKKYDVSGCLTLNNKKEMIISFSYNSDFYNIEYTYPSYQFLQQIFSSDFSFNMHLDACILAMNMKIKSIEEREKLNTIKEACHFYGNRNL